jgi:non-specific serine/threonine protein kinase
MFAHSAWFVDLTPVQNADLVCPTILRVLGAREDARLASVDQLAEHLHEWHVLIVLDNHERVLDAAADLATVLQHCPDVKLLVTSRERLRIRPEHVYSVFPLQVPDVEQSKGGLAPLVKVSGVALFIERAQASDTGFRVSMENAQSVAELCRRLDGLPLAIELAAARVGALSPASMLSRIHDQRDLLKGPRDAPERHQSLSAVTAWSYDLLTERERAVFQILAVFVGGFTLEAVEVVIGMPPTLVIDILTSLVDRSLILPSHAADGVPRYRMLETIREFALDRLADSGQLDQAQRRHSSYFVELAERAKPLLLGPDQTAWFERLELEHDNFRAVLRRLDDDALLQMAMRLGGALWPFWLHRGYASEGGDCLARMLSLDSADTPSVSRSDMLLGAGYLAQTRSELGTARSFLQDALHLQTVRGDEAGAARSVRFLAEVARLTGDTVEAHRQFEDSIERARRAGEPSTEISALLSLVQMALDEDDLAVADEACLSGLALAQDMGWPFGIARAVLTLGKVRDAHGDHAAARLAYEDSLQRFLVLKDQFFAAACLNLLGPAASAAGDYAEAARYVAEGLVIRQQLGDREGMSWSLRAFVGLLVSVGQPMLALQLAGATTALRESIGASWWDGGADAFNWWLARIGHVVRKPDADRAWQLGLRLSVEAAIDMAITAAETLTAHMPLKMDSPHVARWSWLTPREKEVARLVAQGLTNRQIAQELVLSERTAEAHVGSTLGKLGFASRTRLAAWAIRQDLASH